MRVVGAGPGRTGTLSLRILKYAARMLILLVLVGLVAFVFRRYVAIELFALMTTPPALSEPEPEGPLVAWFDDYYVIERIDARTFAIGEPRYYQQNFNYLILGEERAILFDSGPGVRDIRALVGSLTDLPVTAVPSHLHYDHIGNHMRYERLAMIDLPYLRDRARDGVLRPSYWEHLGALEGFARPDLRVTEWWAPDSLVDLGGRRLRVLHTPGHTYDSISLFDAQRRQLFTGDYIHQGTMFVFLPGSSVGDLLRTSNDLLEQLPEDVVLLTGHRAAPPGAPLLSLRHIAALRETLREIRSGSRSGEGFFPRFYRVTNDLSLLTDVPWGQVWD